MTTQQNEMPISPEEDVLPMTADDWASMDEAQRQWEAETRRRCEEQRREAEQRRKEWGDGWNEWRAQQRVWEEEKEEQKRDPKKWKKEKDEEIEKWRRRNDELWTKTIGAGGSSSSNNKRSDATQYTWDWAKLENQEKTFLEAGGCGKIK
ncbi:hypothetical protein niasHT_009670 [Heterodera trifolii]|uniref:Uncharacterized protein n=1 Tax=Heterodera trifolii TaxID=157864 RepID=A0ABD2M0N0_9BILA